MRRALLQLWPALSRVYGLHPWDTERFTPDELATYVDDYDQLLERAQRAAKEVTS